MFGCDYDRAAIFSRRFRLFEHKPDALTLEQTPHQLLNISVLLWQYAIGYNCHLGTEALIGLRQLHANWPTADNDHRLGHYVVIEDVPKTMIVVGGGPV